LDSQQFQPEDYEHFQQLREAEVKSAKIIRLKLAKQRDKFKKAVKADLPNESLLRGALNGTLDNLQNAKKSGNKAEIERYKSILEKLTKIAQR